MLQNKRRKGEENSKSRFIGLRLLDTLGLA